MEPKIAEIAERIHALREIMEFTPKEMADAAGVSEEEYLTLESGKKDFSFTFLYSCAKKFGVDMIELVTGENPHLSGYTVVRAGEGLPIKRRAGFTYFHLAANFKDKLAEPFLVTAPYHADAEDGPIALSTHAGQEMDYVLTGSLRFAHNGHTELLKAGDSVFYNSGVGHGMVAVGGEPCTFLAIVLKKPDKD